MATANRPTSGRSGSAPTTTAPVRPGVRKRWLLLVTAVVVVPLLITGVALVLAGSLQSRSDGYFSTSEQRFATTTAALKSDEIDVGSTSAHPGNPEPDIGELARVRIVMRAVDPQARIFVGVGPKDEVEGYLRGISYDEFVRADLDPFRATFRQAPGVSTASRPDIRPFWVATSSGTGPRTLEWNKTHGAWSVVVMRLDGQPGVDVRATIGLRFGFLLPAGIGALGLAALVLTYALTRRRAQMYRTGG